MSLLDADLVAPSSNRSTYTVHRSKSERKPPRQKKYVPDTIDRLDGSFGSNHYHHQGPYEAALRSYNKYSKYAPLAATEEGNKAAWAATPREAQIDALKKGRPLDNVAVIPPGETGLDGEVMQYKEGTDMLRDPEAGGGAYKRWPGLEYHPDDLKGKGMPGYLIDEKRKAAERQRRARSASLNDPTPSSSSRRRRASSSAPKKNKGGDYEMLMVSRPRPGDRESKAGCYLMVPQWRGHGNDDDDDEEEELEMDEARRHSVKNGGATTTTKTTTRQRSASAAAAGAASSSSRPKEFAEGLKRRIGSLRRK